MNKIKTFFRTLALSAVSPKYYADVLKAKFGFSLKYFLGLQLISAVVLAALIVVPVAQFDLNAFLGTARTWYPQDLVVKLTDGRLSINKPEPYVIPFPEASKDDELQNLVVFDSDLHMRGAADILAYKSLVVLTETTAYVQDERQGNLRTYSLAEAKGNFEVGPKQVDDFFARVKASPFIAQKLYIPTLLFVLLCVMFPFMILFNLITAAVYGFFVWIMARLFAAQLMAGQLLSYKKAVQVTFHSLTLITFVHAGLLMIGQEQYLEGFWYLGAFLVWTAVVLQQSHQSGPVQPVVVKTVEKTSKRKTK